jgi:hypothetical protein
MQSRNEAQNSREPRWNRRRALLLEAKFVQTLDISQKELDPFVAMVIRLRHIVMTWKFKLIWHTPCISREFILRAAPLHTIGSFRPKCRERTSA